MGLQSSIYAYRQRIEFEFNIDFVCVLGISFLRKYVGSVGWSSSRLRQPPHLHTSWWLSSASSLLSSISQTLPCSKWNGFLFCCLDCGHQRYYSWRRFGCMASLMRCTGQNTVSCTQTTCSIFLRLSPHASSTSRLQSSLSCISRSTLSFGAPVLGFKPNATGRKTSRWRSHCSSSLPCLLQPMCLTQAFHLYRVWWAFKLKRGSCLQAHSRLLRSVPSTQ